MNYKNDYLESAKRALENALSKENVPLPIDLEQIENNYAKEVSDIDKYKDNLKVQLLLSFYYICQEMDQRNI